MSLPSRAKGMAFCCTCVGADHFCSRIPRSSRGSRSKDAKEGASPVAFLGVADGDDGSEASGTSFSFNLRFGIVCKVAGGMLGRGS